MPGPGQKSVTFSGVMLKMLEEKYGQAKKERPWLPLAHFVFERFWMSYELEKRNKKNTH